MMNGLSSLPLVWKCGKAPQQHWHRHREGPHRGTRPNDKIANQALVMGTKGFEPGFIPDNKNIMRWILHVK